MAFSDIFYLVIVPILAALVAGFGVNYYAKMRERTRGRAYRERIAILDSAAEQLREEMSRLRELADSRGRLLQRWQSEKAGPLARLRESLGLGTTISSDEAPAGVPADAKKRLAAILEELEQFRCAGVAMLPEIAFDLGLIHFADGQWDKAIALVEEVLQADATNLEARINLGNIFVLRQRFEDARAQFETLVELSSHSFEGHYGLGLSLIGLGRAEEGISCLSTAIRLRPEHARTYCELGKAYVKTGDLERALESAQVALKLDPEMEEAQLLIQQILIRSGKFDEAVNVCRRYLAAGDSPRVHYNLAVAYVMSGDTEAAFEALRRAIQVDDQLRFAAKDNSAFAPLHGSRRFQDLLEGKPGLF